MNHFHFTIFSFTVSLNRTVLSAPTTPHGSSYLPSVYTRRCSIRQPACSPPPPAVPLLVPLSMWPPWPVLCDSTARGPHAQVAMAMTLEGLSQSATHTRTHSLAYTLRQGRRSIFYYTEGSVGGWVGRWELHCSELTAETRGKLERGWVCFSVSDRKCVCVIVCVVFEGAPETAICHWTVVPQTFGFFTH